jgi:hypothetical protein
MCFAGSLTGMLVTALFSISIATAKDVPFSVDISPGEGKPILRSKGRPLSFHEQPSLDSKSVKEVRFKKGDLVPFERDRVVTTRSGSVEVKAEVALTVRNFGKTDSISVDTYYSEIKAAPLLIKAKESVEYLQDRAEGSCFLRVYGNTVEAEECPGMQATRAAASKLVVKTRPQTQWWIFVPSAGGGVGGWTTVSDASFDVEREF